MFTRTVLISVLVATCYKFIEAGVTAPSKQLSKDGSTDVRWSSTQENGGKEGLLLLVLGNRANDRFRVNRKEEEEGDGDSQTTSDSLMMPLIGTKVNRSSLLIDSNYVREGRGEKSKGVGGSEEERGGDSPAKQEFRINVNKSSVDREGGTPHTHTPSSLPRTPPSPHLEFSQHLVVQPKVLHGRTKRHLSSTEQGGEHHDHVVLELPITAPGEGGRGQSLVVDLQLNRNLLSEGYFEKHYHSTGHTVRRPNKETVDLCHYQGSVRGTPESWAALSTCTGISGVLFHDGEMHYIEPVPDAVLESTDDPLGSPHYILQHKHLLPRNLTCGYSGHHHPALQLFKDEAFTKEMRFKRSSRSNSLDDEGAHHSGSIRVPYNSDSFSRYVELVLVADHLEYKNQGEDLKKIHKRFKAIANIANALYQPLNIFIALVGVEVWQEEDQVVISSDGDQTLTNFLNYRKFRLIPEHPNDNAQLLTGQVFDSGVVGKALKGPICTYQYSGGVNMDHSASVGLVATTVAHEMGHNFGMEHDTEDECKCPDSRCIMAPSSGSRSPSHWSTCSREYLALSFERSMDYCLRNKPRSLFQSPVCGNSFVEEGEQCDCGLPEHCDNPCCDPITCTLYENATCATGHCCDLKTCHPKPAGMECRSSLRECDLPEYCLGDSEYCPDDVYKEDGYACKGGAAYCHAGMCRTHAQQCQLLWGPTGQNSHDACYTLNIDGNINGNCGYNWANGTYYKCNRVDRKCGMMHCKHFNERLEFGMESVSKVSHHFIVNEEEEGIIPCRVAQVDLGLDVVDPGLAPDGAKCGYERMCVNQVCMAVASLRKEGCHCNGNGLCNNLGHCHCTTGFAPPDCLYPGLGGSIDSGPASNPNATNKFVVGLLVFFLGIIPMAIIVLCLFYHVYGHLGSFGIWLTKKGLPGSTRFVSTDGSCRTGRAGSSSTAGVPSLAPYSDLTAHGSSDSKSNSPLLNGNVANGAPLNGELIGKHDGFTLTPLKSASPPGNSVAVGVTASSRHPVRKAPPAPPPPTSSPSNVPAMASSSGKKFAISSPSLKGSTNKAVCPATPPGYASPPPLFPVDPNNEVAVPVAVVIPNRRPMSVPDESCILVGRSSVPPCNPSGTAATSSPLMHHKPSTVSRLASFLTKKDQPQISGSSIKSDGTSDDEYDGSRSSTLPRKAKKIKRESLMQMEISAPMELHATKLPDNLVPVRPAPCPPPIPNVKPSEVKLSQNYNKNDGSAPVSSVQDDTATPKMEEGRRGSKDSSSKVRWASSVEDKDAGCSSGAGENLQRMGSMREQPVTMRPAIPKFGSMRTSRPKSLPPARPSQPPPRPPLPDIPPSPDDYYDECAAEVRDTAASPTDSIYATIDENGAPVLPPDEPYYENNSAVQRQKETPPPKQPKKSVFSFLYTKTKRKKKETTEGADEPLYCNVDSPTSGAADIPEVMTVMPSSEGRGKALTAAVEVAAVPAHGPRTTTTDRGSTPSSVVDGRMSSVDRTSCGSSEDGGLLSEIVSELVTREPQFTQALSKNKKRDKTPATINGGSKVPAMPSVESTSPVHSSSRSPTLTSLPPPPSLPSAAAPPDAVASPTKTSALSNISTSKPRGVFSYLRRNLSDDSEKTEVQRAGTPSTATPDIKCPITAVTNTTITTHITTTPQPPTTSSSSNSSSLSGSKSLESSLARVRAASNQLSGSRTATPTLPVYTNIPESSPAAAVACVNNKVEGESNQPPPSLPIKLKKLKEEQTSSLGSSSAVPGDAKNRNLLSSTQASTPPPSSASSSSTTSIAVAPHKSGSKVVFPPDKVVGSDRGKSAPGPRAAAAGARGSGRIKSAGSKAASKGAATAKSSAAGKPTNNSAINVLPADGGTKAAAAGSKQHPLIGSKAASVGDGHSSDKAASSIPSSLSSDGRLLSGSSGVRKPISKPAAPGSKPSSGSSNRATSSSASKNTTRVLSPTRSGGVGGSKQPSASPTPPPTAADPPSSDRLSSRRSSGGKAGVKKTAGGTGGGATITPAASTSSSATSRSQAAAFKGVGSSNVASLQQKFEEKKKTNNTSSSAKPNLAPKPAGNNN